MSNKTVVLLTQHVWRSKRRAGFHWIADELWGQGWNVYFVTDWLSLFDKFKGDYRFKYLPVEGTKKVVSEKERFYSYVCYHPWRPLSRMGKFLNTLTYNFFRHYGSIKLPELEEVVRKADLVIFEASMGLMFFERFKVLNPNADFVYRVSDDLHLFKTHPVVLDTEARIAPLFDLISVPTSAIYTNFSHLPNVKLQKHGIPLRLYEIKYNNPYIKYKKKNAVFVGNLFLDYDFIDRASRLFPQIIFHIIGPFEELPQRENIVAYGEMPYVETIPFVQYADIGLNTRTIPSLSDSNKMIQYQYCKLPVVMADVDFADKSFVFHYQPGNDESIYAAVMQALQYDRNQILTSEIQSWSRLARQLAGEIQDDR